MARSQSPPRGEARRAGQRRASRADFEQYFRGIAEARYVIRKAFRIVDEQARKAGLEALQHQALIQIYGATHSEVLRINDVAERLDVPAAFASRLVKDLEGKGLVERLDWAGDRRITHVQATEAGREVLARIDQDVQLHVGYFQKQLTDSERVAAFAIFAFYLGATPDLGGIDRLMELARGQAASPGA